jgi:hypothetical protein
MQNMLCMTICPNWYIRILFPPAPTHTACFLNLFVTEHPQNLIYMQKNIHYTTFLSTYPYT